MTVQSVSFYSDRIGDLIKKDNRPLVVKRFEKCHSSLSMYFQCRLKSMTLFGHKLSISLSLLFHVSVFPSLSVQLLSLYSWFLLNSRALFYFAVSIQLTVNK